MLSSPPRGKSAMVGQSTVGVSAQDTAGRNKLLTLCPSSALSQLPHRQNGTATVPADLSATH